MPSSNRLKRMFKEPRQWGLRGDPFLWNELREHFTTSGLPKSQDEFLEQIETVIKELTGSDLRGDTPIFVKRYDAGGMSSGHVCSEWWRTTGIPLLLKQFGDRSTPSRSRNSDSRFQLAVQQTLQDRLRTTIKLDDKGYVQKPEQNLLPGVRLEYFEDDLQQGAGSELQTKFRAAHSSSALAVNSFAWFCAVRRLHHLNLLGASCAKELKFERKCPIFRGGRAPHLDVWIEFDGEVIAIESKLTEYLAKTKPEFSPAYERLAPPGLSEPCWWNLYQDAKKGTPTYLDRAQLLKHYFGLRKFQQKKDAPGQITLLYLYWKPGNADDIEICKSHQLELAAFERSVADSEIKFCSMSYLQLWRDWQKVPELADHVHNLQSRYEAEVHLRGGKG